MISDDYTAESMFLGSQDRWLFAKYVHLEKLT